MGVQGNAIRSITHTNQETQSIADADGDFYSHRLLKPIPHTYDAELKALADAISRDIYQESPNVRWDDVVELEDAKRLLEVQPWTREALRH
jgi:SpoVK/Ycf46/Vps4 family AAA+-type ATPase